MESPVGDHELHVYIHQASVEMESEYKRIRKRSVEDPGTAGDEGEENWAKLLRSWLPSNYHVVTKGRVLAADGRASGQLDVLVLHPSYPLGLLHKKLFLAPGVIAAFECKITLKREHVNQAVKKGAELKRMYRDSEENFRSVPMFGLLAHAHSWRSQKEVVVERISAFINTADRAYVEDPLECLDALCIATLGTWVLMKGRFEENEHVTLKTMYMAPMLEVGRQEVSVLPIGRFLNHFFVELAQRDNTLRPYREYFSHAGLEDVGIGEARDWPGYESESGAIFHFRRVDEMPRE